MIKSILLVGLGSSIGGILRYLVSILVKQQNFPVNTFLVNFIGSFCIGVVYALAAKPQQISEPIKLFLATGICGGFTTFSAFSIEVMLLLKQQQYPFAMLYIVSSIVTCLIAVFIGFKLVQY